ncbi:MAG: MFS transporter [Holosporaceae bacterium]|jgi:MFS family permease|nr:MFS transporter [Holosporaceae bacterium]
MSEPKAKGFANSLIIWGLASIFYLYEVVLRVSPSVMTNDLMFHYGITTGMLGMLISCFYYPYALLQLPCGLILDKIGPRNLIGFSVLLSILGSVLFALTNSLWVAQLGRCLVGSGAACAFVSCLQIASVVFSTKYFAVFTGIANMMGTLGGLCAGFPLASCVNSIGWRETIFLLASVGFIIAVLVFLLVPKSITAQKKIKKKPSSFWGTLINVIKNKQIILLGLVGGFMYLPISVFSELWAVPFFMAKYQVGIETASLASSVIFVGFAIGSIPVALVARKLGGYVRTMRLSIVGVAILFIPLIYVDNMPLSFVILFLIGVFTSGEILVFTCAKDNESPRNAGTAIAFSNAILMLIGSIFQPVLGILLDVFWTGELSSHGVRIYGISCYQWSILTLPICLGVAYGVSLLVKETIAEESALEKEPINGESVA